MKPLIEVEEEEEEVKEEEEDEEEEGGKRETEQEKNDENHCLETYTDESVILFMTHSTLMNNARIWTSLFHFQRRSCRICECLHIEMS